MCNFKKFPFLPRTLHEWNELPSHVALAESLESFQKAIFTIRYVRGLFDLLVYYLTQSYDFSFEFGLTC